MALTVILENTCLISPPKPHTSAVRSYFRITFVTEISKLTGIQQQKISSKVFHRLIRTGDEVDGGSGKFFEFVDRTLTESSRSVVIKIMTTALLSSALP